jgi:hypothetical protein
MHDVEERRGAQSHSHSRVEWSYAALGRISHYIACMEFRANLGLHDAELSSLACDFEFQGVCRFDLKGL